VQVAGWLSVADFVVVQDYFMTETAKHADLILPASFPVESGGSFTNTQKVIQQFKAQFAPVVEVTGVQQLAAILEKFGLAGKSDVDEILAEAMSLLIIKGDQKFQFITTHEDNENRMYRHGCDSIVKRFDEEFVHAFENTITGAYERV
jgi:formate dehydrogenase major subunit